MRFVRLPSQVYVILAGRFVNDLGRGFSMLFISVYFHERVGFSMTVVNWGLALFSASGIVSTFLGGYICDRFGRKRSLTVSMLGSALLFGSYPLLRHAGTYLFASALSGAFLSLYWPASGAMITDLTPPEHRGHAFTLYRIVINGAIGLGVIGAGILVYTLHGRFDDPSRVYHILFWIDASTYLIFLVILQLFIVETLPANAGATYGGFWKGWGEALRDGNLLLFTALMTQFTLVYSIYNLLPVVLKEVVDLDALPMSWVMSINTGLIVVLQLPTWAAVAAWRRTRALVLAGLLFGAGLAGFALACTEPFAGILMASIAMVILTFGEMLHGPGSDALVSSLAPSHLRGTYMSVGAATWHLGLSLGQILSGPLLDAGRPRTLFLVFAAMVSCAAAGLFILERRLPEATNRQAPAPRPDAEAVQVIG